MKKNRVAESVKKYGILLAGVLLLVCICIYIEFDISDFVFAVPEFFRFLIFDFLPPSLSKWKEYINPILETFYFAIVATFVSSLIAVVFGFIAAGRMPGTRLIGYIVKFLASIIRNIPVLVWASILVIIFGIGVVPGLLSLIIFDIGFLVRSYSEAIEEMDTGMLEAMKAAGVRPIVQVFRGELPMFMPSFYSWTLFVFEINIRASAILGIVGAGGLGVKLKEATGVFRYHEAAAIIIVMVVMILGVEFITNKIKEAMV